MTIPTRDIIRMAREAGIGNHLPAMPGLPGTWIGPDLEKLKILSELVAAHERTARQAAQAENAELKERLARSGVELRKAVRDEREACHAIRQTLPNPYADGCQTSAHAYDMAIADYGKAIRARSGCER